MKKFRVAVLANLKKNAPNLEGMPKDMWDDLDSEKTIEALLEGIRSGGHECEFLEGNLSLVETLPKFKPDICFNICEGHWGDSREAHVPAILEMLRTGRWMQLERLRGSLDAEQVFQSIPGVGPELAKRIHAALEIETLAELEQAAHDGRLEQVPGVGPRRSRMVAAALAHMLQRRPAHPPSPAAEPGVELLLDVDHEYREKAADGKLRKIAPKRFNPDGEAWLPILHTQRDGWEFTALFSNTARAHDLGKTDDWVVLYFHSDHGPEGQRTVVTETSGPLAGRRVVRGREAECR